MPNPYAHHRFGKEVFDRLPEGGCRAAIQAHWDLFLAGLYGPDLFFFYQPLSRTAVGRLGNVIHRETGTVFFARAGERLNVLPDQQAGEAYLYGYLCHFALDAASHSFVEYMVRRRGYDHSAMETDLDRALLEQDGLNPLHHLAVGHLKAERPLTEIVAAIHGITVPEAGEAVSSMKRYSRLLLPTSEAKRAVLTAGLKLAGRYDRLHGLLMPKDPQPQFDLTRRELLACYAQALPQAVELMETYRAYLRGDGPLTAAFDRIFNEDAAEMQRIEERMNDV